MDVYLWRHGQAEGRAPSGRDADRRLVPLGEQEVKSVAQAVLSRGASVQKIFSSPYRRAWDTAQLILQALQCPLGLEELTELASGATFNDVDKIFKSIKTLPPSFALVGHMPDLSQFADNLLKKRDETLAFSPGAVAKIKLSKWERHSGKLEWLISPSDLIY